MFWIYNKKTVSTKIRNNNIEFDIRDGLSENQRKVLFAIYFLNDSPKYEDVMTYDEIKKELKSNKIYNYSDNELKEIINGFSKQKYPILSVNENKEICKTRVFDKMFEGQKGTDYTQDSVLSSLFPNYLCNGGNGYSPHDIADVCEAINRYVNNREISDEEIHDILKDNSDNDLKVIVEAFVNHRISVLGRINRFVYDSYEKNFRILKFGSEKDKKGLLPICQLKNMNN